MDALTNLSSRPVVFAFALAIVFLLAFALGALIVAILFAGNMWMGMGGMMNQMMDMNGKTMTDMMSVCTEMMPKTPSP